MTIIVYLRSYVIESKHLFVSDLFGNMGNLSSLMTPEMMNSVSSMIQNQPDLLRQLSGGGANSDQMQAAFSRFSQFVG